MRNAVCMTFAVFLSVSPVPSARPALGADASPAAPPSPVPSPSSKRLRLGPYVDPYAPVPVERMFDVPRFDTRVEVHGKAMDRVALTARMEWWMRDFEPMRGAVSRAGSAPSLEEMKEHRHHPPDAINVEPILDWLLGKLNKKP